MRYSECWKCNSDISSKEQCNYIKTRNGNFDLCPKCYEEFLEKNKDSFKPESCRKDEISRSILIAMKDFHTKMLESNKPIEKSLTYSFPTILIHKETSWFECDICLEMMEAMKNR